MYGRGSGVKGLTGATSTVAGITALPNTAGNTALMVLSATTAFIGVVIFASFVFTRAAKKFYQ